MKKALKITLVILFFLVALWFLMQFFLQNAIHRGSTADEDFVVERYFEEYKNLMEDIEGGAGGFPDYRALLSFSADEFITLENQVELETKECDYFFVSDNPRFEVENGLTSRDIEDREKRKERAEEIVSNRNLDCYGVTIQNSESGVFEDIYNYIYDEDTGRHYFYHAQP